MSAIDEMKKAIGEYVKQNTKEKAVTASKGVYDGSRYVLINNKRYRAKHVIDMKYDKGASVWCYPTATGDAVIVGVDV